MPTIDVLLTATNRPTFTVDVLLTGMNRPRRTREVVLTASNIPSIRTVDVVLHGTNIPTRRVLDVLLSASNVGAPIVRAAVPSVWEMQTTATFGGEAIKNWSFSRSGDQPSLTVVFRGDYRSFSGSNMRITVRAVNTATGETRSFSTEYLRGNGAARYVETPVGGETTLQFGSAATDPANKPLPELLDWQDEDEELQGTYTPEAIRYATRKRLPVQALLSLAAQTAGVTVVIQGAAPFNGEIVQKTGSDYSTRGKTLVQVLQDWYGKAGYNLLYVDNQLWVCEPFPTTGGISLINQSGALTGRETSPVKTEEYGRILLTGTPMEARLGDLVDFGDSADQPHTQLEINANNKLHTITQTNTGYTVTGIEKSGGRVIATGSLSVGEVRVKPPEATDAFGVPLTETVYRGVALEESNTNYYYLPDAPNVLRMTKEINKKWVYTWRYDVIGRKATLSIPDYSVTVPAGYVLGDEITTTWYSYSPQGWLQKKVTEYRKILSLIAWYSGSNVEDVGDGEANTMITTEKWAPVGGGLWSYQRQTFASQHAPTFNAEDLQWMDLLITSGIVESYSEITDQAPTHIRMPERGAEQTVQDQLVLIPREYELTSGTGTENLTVDFPTETTSLGTLASILQKTVRPRIQTDWQYALPVSVRVWDVHEGHRVTGLSASGNGGAGFALQVTGEKLI